MDDSHKLHWSNYQNNIKSSFQNLRDDEDFVDVTLACDGRFLKAHRVVLSACSSYFRELLKSTPCKHPIIVLQDITFNNLLALVEFIYHGEVSVRQGSLNSFLKMAKVLKISGLAQQVDQTNKDELSYVQTLTAKDNHFTSQEKESDNKSSLQLASVTLKPKTMQQLVHQTKKKNKMPSSDLYKENTKRIKVISSALINTNEISVTKNHQLSTQIESNMLQGGNKLLEGIKNETLEVTEEDEEITLKNKESSSSRVVGSVEFSSNRETQFEPMAGTSQNLEGTEKEGDCQSLIITCKKQHQIDPQSNQIIVQQLEDKNPQVIIDSYVDNENQPQIEFKSEPLSPGIDIVDEFENSFLQQEHISKEQKHSLEELKTPLENQKNPSEDITSEMKNNLFFYIKKTDENDSILYQNNVNESKSNNRKKYCKICDRYFSRAWSLQRHLTDTHYYIPQPHSCNLCGKSYKSRNSLISHKSQYHTKREPKDDSVNVSDDVLVPREK